MSLLEAVHHVVAHHNRQLVSAAAPRVSAQRARRGKRQPRLCAASFSVHAMRYSSFERAAASSVVDASSSRKGFVMESTTMSRTGDGSAEAASAAACTKQAAGAQRCAATRGADDATKRTCCTASSSCSGLEEAVATSTESQGALS